MNAEKLSLPGADVLLYRQFYAAAEAEQLFRELLQAVAWQQEELKLYGRVVPVPRLVAWYGEPEAVYTYSGVVHEPLPFTPLLLEIKAKVEKTLQKRFNSVLLNRYRTGADSMGWHSDNEPELGPEPVIASLSLGAPRRFSFRHKTDQSLKPVHLLLAHGDLLLMQGPTQRHWQHSLPKTAKAVGERINLTFRLVL